MNIKLTYTPGYKERVNSGVICRICGRLFDEDGNCGGGHRRDQLYYIPPEAVEPVSDSRPEAQSQPDSAICQFDGNRCSICGGCFEEGDDMCPKGHQVGQTYVLEA